MSLLRGLRRSSHSYLVFLAQFDDKKEVLTSLLDKDLILHVELGNNAKYVVEGVGNILF